MTDDGPVVPWGRAAFDLHFGTLAVLVDRMDRARSLDEASRLLVDFACEHLGADAAGISMRARQGPAQQLSASTPALAELDTMAAAGPGSSMEVDGTVVVVPDTRTDRRWPLWSTAVADLGLRSACLVALPALRGRTALLELYSRQPAAFDADQTILVRSAARCGGLGLRYVDRRANLEDALHTRALIGQAQGVLMERYGLSGEQAMSFLRRRSQHSQVKIRELAARLVEWFEPGSSADREP